MKFIVIAFVVAILWMLNQPKLEEARVKYVVDGDTIVLTDGRKVRLLQINAPEENQCGHEAASRELRELVQGKEVTLESDPMFGDMDKYERLLRYVHVGDVNVNVQLQQEGLVDSMFYEGQHGKYAYLMHGQGSCAN